MAGDGEIRTMANLPDRVVSLRYAAMLHKFMTAQTPAVRRHAMMITSKLRAEMDRRGLPVECI